MAEALLSPISDGMIHIYGNFELVTWARGRRVTGGLK